MFQQKNNYFNVIHMHTSKQTYDNQSKIISVT